MKRQTCVPFRLFVFRLKTVDIGRKRICGQIEHFFLCSVDFLRRKKTDVIWTGWGEEENSPAMNKEENTWSDLKEKNLLWKQTIFGQIDDSFGFFGHAQVDFLRKKILWFKYYERKHIACKGSASETVNGSKHIFSGY